MRDARFNGICTGIHFQQKKQMQIYPTIHFNQNTIMQTNSLGVLLYSQ